MADESGVKFGKKRGKNKAEWAREKRKLARIAGRSYVNSRGELVQARQMGSDCGCRRKCYAKVPPSVRSAVFDEFYRLGSYDEQNAYLYGLIRREAPSRHRAKDPAKARGNSYQYFVRVHGLDVQVCREAFANIHAVSAHKIRILCRKLERNVAYPRDERGKHGNRKKTPGGILDLIRAHLRGLVDSGAVGDFVKDERRARRGHHPPVMNITKMWKHFLETHDPKFPGYVISKKSQIHLRGDENEAPVEPLAKHWIYSKVFHDEFEAEVTAALEASLDGNFEEPVGSGDHDYAETDLPSFSSPETDVAGYAETGSPSADFSLPSSSSSPPPPDVVSAATPDLDLDQDPDPLPHAAFVGYDAGTGGVGNQGQVGLPAPAAGPDVAPVMQIHLQQPGDAGAHSAVILPASVQGLGPVNLLVEANGQARILPPTFEQQQQQQQQQQHRTTQLVVLPVAFAQVSLPCFPGVVVADFGAALRPSFIG